MEQEYSHSNGTVFFQCPYFTDLKRDDDSGIYSCEYDVWFYGVAATLVCFGALFPIILLICCWARWKNSKNARKKLHRQDSDASTFTDVSRPHDHGVYEILRNENDRDLYFRTAREGPYRKRYGTFSVPDLKSFNARDIPHIYPEITQLDTQSVPTSPAAAFENSGSKDVHFDDHSPSSSHVRRSREALHSASMDRKSPYSQNDKDSVIVKAAESPCNSNLDRKSLKNNPDNCKNTEYEDEIDNDSSTESVGLTMNHDTTIPKQIPTSQVSVSENLPELIAPKNSNESIHFPSFQPTPPVKHLVERLDFDHYLYECVSKLPEDQRNGTFLIRDSQSRPGSKVLSIYCKGSEPALTLYHYQVCFDEDEKVHVSGSKDIFSDLDKLVDFYRSKRTFLPCLLSNCLGKNF